MPRCRATLVALACTASLLVGLAMAAVGAPAAPDPTARPIEPTGSVWVSDRLLELSFANPRVDPPVDPTRVRVLVPGDWRTSGQRYPVVFLLHGAGDRHDGWTTKQDGWPVTLEEFTAGKDVVIVMPDGGSPGSPGWYSDWFNGGEFGAPQWETWHIAQLIPWVKANLPVRTDRGGWVVAGLSMGGFGAMSYLARHPDVFAAGFSFSGALSLIPAGRIAAPVGVWGTVAEQEVRYRGHDPTSLVANLADAEAIWFRTGQGLPGGPAPKDADPAGQAIEAGAWETNVRFDLALDRAGVDHHFEAYPFGAHNWWHWHAGFQEHAWPVMADLFARGDIPDVPDSFHYRTIEPTFEVYGWKVTVDREVVEFLTMDGVGPDGLAIRGSGTVTVTTPPVHDPGAGHRIRVTGTPTVESGVSRVVADERGRLRFEVVLGPSHRSQQFTASQRAQALLDPGYWQRARVAISPSEVVPAPTPEATAPPPAAAPDPAPAPRAEAVEPSLPATGRTTAPMALLVLVAAVAICSRRRVQ